MNLGAIQKGFPDCLTPKAWEKCHGGKTGLLAETGRFGLVSPWEFKWLQGDL